MAGFTKSLVQAETPDVQDTVSRSILDFLRGRRRVFEFDLPYEGFDLVFSSGLHAGLGRVRAATKDAHSARQQRIAPKNAPQSVRLQA